MKVSVSFKEIDVAVTDSTGNTVLSYHADNYRTEFDANGLARVLGEVQSLVMGVVEKDFANSEEGGSHADNYKAEFDANGLVHAFGEVQSLVMGVMEKGFADSEEGDSHVDIKAGLTE